MVFERRLRWRCRRGTREMDLILDRFLTAAGDTLDEDDRQGLGRLLEQSDRDILDWIARRSAPPNTALTALVDRIRSASTSASGKDRFPRAT